MTLGEFFIGIIAMSMLGLAIFTVILIIAVAVIAFLKSIK